MMYSFSRYPIILGFNEPDRGNRAFGADLRFTFGVLALFPFLHGCSHNKLHIVHTSIFTQFEISLSLPFSSFYLVALTTNYV